MPVTNIEELKRKVESIGNLPTFPENASRVIELVNDPTVSMKEIKDEISMDPALAAKVLKFVNSAFYGISQGVSSLQLALVILGIREIRNIVIGLSVFKAFDDFPESTRFNRKRFWQHSVSCAQVTRTLASKLSFKMEGEDFTAGLLHDIGKIAIDQYLPEDFAIAWRKSMKEGISLHDAEYEYVGVTHTEVGAWLAENWNLPDQLIDVIRYHHYPEKAKHNPLVALVSLSDVLSKSEGMKFGGTFTRAQLEKTSAWQILLREKEGVAEIDLERLTFELESEMMRALEFLSVVKPGRRGSEVKT